jgi:NADH-quinone oxidoreductase subunit J
MLDINIDSIRKGFWKHFPLAAMVGVLIALEMAYVLFGGFREPARARVVLGQGVAPMSNTQELGKLLYTQYLYPLEIAAVILLVAIIAAIALTLRERKDSKHMDASDQVRVKARDRVTLVHLAATKKIAVEPVTERSAEVKQS